MRQSSKVNNGVSVIVGTFLLIEGVWGLFSKVVFGVLTTNIVHAVLHMIFGAIAIVLCVQHRAKGFSIFVGLLLSISGLLYFIPGVDSLVINILNMNRPVAFLNIIIGVLLLTVASYKKPREAQKFEK